ncbi:RNA-directed DNA polymerase [Pectobacterium brasiliense]|uniref:reverse transcriptase domain-containing protein n=1 Tax=Pectobacterium brasiliense TaxID=180957 RepID=UPI0019696A14|nr:reverse transcriptase domain-containing protein [Pectobacterium brasiliense]QSD22407.1 RNA-directed DNA polymerase [Pectobacterium brasiliense]
MHIIDRNHLKISILPKDIFVDGIVNPIPSSAVTEKNVKGRCVYILEKNSDYAIAQRNLVEQFLSKIEVNNSAKGFRKNLSYLNFLEPHASNYYFLRLDVKNFFHSIDERLLKKCFFIYFKDEFIDSNNKQKLLDAFMNLITFYVPSSSKNINCKEKRIIPVGFSSSPLISNIFFRSIDILLQKLCIAFNITYTRYADDLLFSAVRGCEYIHSDSFEKEVRIILGTMSLKINNNKIIRAKHRISLNGYVIQARSLSKKKSANDYNGVFISNKKTETIGKVLYELSLNSVDYKKIMEKIIGNKIKISDFNYPLTYGFIIKYYKTQTRNYLSGYRSYLISFLKFNEIYRCVPDIKINVYKDLLDKIDKFLV